VRKKEKSFWIIFGRPDFTEKKKVILEIGNICIYYLDSRSGH
jgi:hypothetical protein